MVGVKLPEFAVNNVEVFVGKVLSDFVDVLLLVDNLQDLEEITVPEVPQGDSGIVPAVELVKDAINDRVRVPVLELRRLLKEFKSRMSIK